MQHRHFNGQTTEAIATLQQQFGLPVTGEWTELERLVFQGATNGTPTTNAGKRALAPPTARGKRALENAQMYYTSVESSDDLFRYGGNALQRFVQPGFSGDILTGLVWGIGVASAVSFANDLFEDYLQPGQQRSKKQQRRRVESKEEGLLPQLNFFGGGGGNRGNGGRIQRAFKQGGGQRQQQQQQQQPFERGVAYASSSSPFPQRGGGNAPVPYWQTGRTARMLQEYHGASASSNFVPPSNVPGSSAPPSPAFAQMNTNASASMSVKEMNALRKEITRRNASQAFAQYNNSSGSAPAQKRNTKLGSRDAALEPIQAKSRTQTLERPGYANDGFGEYGNKNGRQGNNSSNGATTTSSNNNSGGAMDEHNRGPLYVQGLDFLREIPSKVPNLFAPSEFSARAIKERELEASIQEARRIAENERAEKHKAQEAFARQKSELLEVSRIARQASFVADSHEQRIKEIQEKLNAMQVNEGTKMESLVGRIDELESFVKKSLQEKFESLEVAAERKFKQLALDVERVELAMKDAGSNLDELDTIGQVTMALSSVKNDVTAKLQAFETQLNEQLEATSRQMKEDRESDTRADIAFAKLDALEHTLLDVQSGAGAEIERLQAHIDRLEASLQAAPAPAVVENEIVQEEEEEKEEVIIPSSSAYTEVDTLEELDVVEEQEQEEVVEEVVEEKKQQLENLFAAPSVPDVVIPVAPQVSPVPEVEKEDDFVEGQIFETGIPKRIATGREVMLQGFHWESHKSEWYDIVSDRVEQIRDAGFTQVWLPPSADSLAPQGYLPRNLYKLDSHYGSAEKLKALTRKMKENNILPVLDAVLNHRCATHQGAGGKWNRWEGTGIDWGEWAISNEQPDFAGSGNAPTGDVFHGAPNIDHTQERVRQDLCKYMRYLTSDEVGFGGIRFDFSKGYGGSFTGEYVRACEDNVEFAVGEFWDTMNYGVGLEYNQDSHRQAIVDWVDQTGGCCTAFDFTTKGILQEACGRGEFWRLVDAQGRAPGVIGLWPARAVTFLDNHDTGSTQAHWPFPGSQVGQGYAYILTHPGTPCVFWDHYFDWGDDLRKQIDSLLDVRDKMKIHARSVLKIEHAKDNLYAAKIDDKVAVKLGREHWEPKGDGWKVDAFGDDWCVWTLTK